MPSITIIQFLLEFFCYLDHLISIICYYFIHLLKHETDLIKDLGVVIQDNLSPEKRIDRSFGDTFRMLRNMRMAFYFLDKNMMRKIISTMIRPKLEYAEVIWSPHKKKHVLKLERIQRIAIKMVPELEDLHI